MNGFNGLSLLGYVVMVAMVAVWYMRAKGARR